jgi:hypothetical protein
VRKATLAAVAALATLPLSTQAAAPESFQLRSAQDLAALCAVPEGDAMAEAARSFCYGYLRGVHDLHGALKPTARDAPFYCIPTPAPTRAEAAEKFVAWGRANAQHLSEPAVDALIRFAVATWPCPAAAAPKAK